MHNLFDIWMSRVGYDTFLMVVNFVNIFWEPIHVIVRVFEVQNTIDETIKNQVKILLDSFGLLNKVITYVKNEGSNLNTLTNALKYVFSCSLLQLFTSFVRPCNVKKFTMPLITPKFVKFFQKLI
jgi:hypothetical protein